MNNFLSNQSRDMSSWRRGFTLVELLVVSALGMLVSTLIIGMLVDAREMSQQEICADKLRTIIMGVRDYEQTQQRFPPGRLRPDWVSNGIPFSGYTNYSNVNQTSTSSTGFYSVHVWILPYVNAQSVYSQIDFSRAQAKQMTQQGQPYNINYTAYISPMPLFLCPADSNTTGSGTAENNYRYNFGGATPGAGAKGNNQYEQGPFDRFHPGGNGAFTIGTQGMEASAFIDGLSTTIFFSERTKGDASDSGVTLAANTAIQYVPGSTTLTPDTLYNNCSASQPVLSPFIFTASGRYPTNSDWANGWPFAGYDSTQYNHVAPPNWNSLDCALSTFIPDTHFEHAIIAARSEHENCVNVAFGDGHVRATRDDINLEVWRAMGTRNGEELTQVPVHQEENQQQQSQQGQQD